MKIHVKKKLYRLMCKMNVRSGVINRPDGSWGPGIDNAMKACMIAGHGPGSKGKK